MSNFLLRAATIYQGTKTADLSAYITSIIPSLRIRRDPYAAGPGTRDPSLWNGRISLEDAHKLGSKLISSGWTGKKERKTVPATATFPERVLEFVRYHLDSSGLTFVPLVKIYKPTKGETTTRITIQHPTIQSHREHLFLKRLNRPQIPRPTIKRPGGRSGPSMWDRR